NAAVGEPFRNQSEHFALSWRELVERARLSCAIEELCCKSWVDDGLACGDTFERGDELLDVEDALLEEIARATAAAFEQLQRVVGLDVLGEHEDGDVGEAPADLFGYCEPLGAPGRRHADVDHGDIGVQ